MKYKRRLGVVFTAATLAAACGDGEGPSVDRGTDAVHVIVSSDIEPGETCEAGGRLVQSGVDANDDGELDATEVTGAYNICDGAASVGDDGPSGADGESGSDGESGTDGAAGKNVLSTTTSAGAGDCPTGGVLISTGLDDDGNGSLEAGEVDSAMTVCNAEHGDGACAPLMRVEPIEPGSTCPLGGYELLTGADSGELSGMGGAASATACDGLLTPGEETNRTTVCHGSDGATGASGATGDAGATGSAGAIGATGNAGATGATGDAGATGATGDAGATGATGDAGATGATGDAGATGATGDAGDAGATGATGATGDAGATGATGATGDAGATGATGTAGLNDVLRVTPEAPGPNCTDGGFFVERGSDLNGNGSLDSGEELYSTYLCVDGDLDGDGVPNQHDNCQGVSNLAQIDQDGDGEGDLCDATPCVGNVCETTCSGLRDLGATVDGHYVIDPSGASPIAAYCDQTTDGGGWTMVLNYAHAAGTDPALNPRTTDLPVLQAGTALGDDQSGSEFWGHASPELFAQLDVDDTRFVASSGGHARIYNFYTDACNDYFATGSGYCADIQTNHVLLGGHSGFLPAAGPNYWADQGDLAMTNFPYWLSGTYHWGIGAGGRWEVDDISTNHDTWHQIFVRSDAVLDEPGYELLYEYDLPVESDLDTLADLASITTLDRSLELAGVPYSRVAFRYQLDDQVVWTSMDDFAGGNIAGLTVPVDQVFDGAINNLHVLSNVPAVTPVTGSATGKLEFWSNCYGTAPTTVYDTDDTRDATDCYGSMQVHDGTSTVWSFNAWSSASPADDFGIGTYPGVPNPHPDWTFAYNGASFAQRQLQVYILPDYPTSCLDAQAQGATTDGVYAVDPDGLSGPVAPFDVYCDMTSDGGGWTLIGKTNAGDYTGLSDQEYIDLLVNVEDDVNPGALLDGSLPADGVIAFLNWEKTNALHAAHYETGVRNAVVRLQMANNIVWGNGLAMRTFFQQKLDTTPGFDLWSGIRNPLAWGSGSDGTNATIAGIDYAVADSIANLDLASNVLTHTAPSPVSHWNLDLLTDSNGYPTQVGNHFGLLCDGYGGWEWMLTSFRGDARWRNNTAGSQDSIVWLR